MSHLEYVWEEASKKLRSLKYKSGLVLDVGCGTEHFQTPFKEEIGMRWHGLDKGYIREEHLLSPPYIKDYMEDMRSVQNDTYDLVFSCHSFEHCTRPIDALREFHRVLKPNGYVFIATPYPCKHHILEADDDHLFVLTKEQMKRLLLFVGLVEVETYVSKKAMHKQDWNLISIGRKT